MSELRKSKPRSSKTAAKIKIKKCIELLYKKDPVNIILPNINNLLKKIPTMYHTGPVLYFITSNSRNECDLSLPGEKLYKVGVTEKLKKRLSKIGTKCNASEGEIDISGIVPFDTMRDAMDMEKIIKQKLKRFRLKSSNDRLSSFKNEVFIHTSRVLSKAFKIMSTDTDFIQTN